MTLTNPERRERHPSMRAARNVNECYYEHGRDSGGHTIASDPRRTRTPPRPSLVNANRRGLLTSSERDLLEAEMA